MALYGEPKDGDFVRYIETLNRQANSSPGQVLPRQRRGKKLSNWKGTAGQPDAPSAAPAPIAHSQNASPGATRETDDDAGETTLAARSGQRHLSLGLAIAGVVALWNALDRLFVVVRTGSFDLDSLVPVVFLLICAWMLFKGARGARRKQRQPLAKLPPLTTQIGRNPRN